MVATDKDPRTEDPMVAVEKKILALFDDDAGKVVTALQDSSVVVVTGPFGNGKTQSLIPQIALRLQEQGQDVILLDGQLFKGSPLGRIREELPENPQNGVVVIDEATTFIDTHQVQDIRVLAHEQGYEKLIPIIAYNIDYPEVKDQLAACWTEANSAVIHFPPKLLPIGIAREFLQARGRFMNTPSDAIEFVLETLPLNLRALNVVSGHSTLAGIKDVIWDNADNWQGAIPASQIAAVKQKIRANR